MFLYNSYTRAKDDTNVDMHILKLLYSADMLLSYLSTGREANYIVSTVYGVQHRFTRARAFFAIRREKDWSEGVSESRTTLEDLHTYMLEVTAMTMSCSLGTCE